MRAFDRIKHDPCVMGGKPTIRGLRITVAMIVGQLGAGRSVDEVVQDFPNLEREDVLQALRYAAACVDGRDLLLARFEEARQVISPLAERQALLTDEDAYRALR